MRRSVIAYDDIATSNSPVPLNSIPSSKPGPSLSFQTHTQAGMAFKHVDRPTPAKRQKREGGQFDKPHPSSSIQHWDDPGTSQDVLSYDDPTPVAHEEDPRVDEMGVEEEEAEEQEGEMSRHLTHEEIWDDSALIEAWNAANEEYEVRSPIPSVLLFIYKLITRQCTAQVRTGRKQGFTSRLCQSIPYLSSDKSRLTFLYP